MIGLAGSEAFARCQALGDPFEFRRGDERSKSLCVHRTSGLSIFVYFGTGDVVDALEFGRPHDGEVIVMSNDIDVFGTSAEELVEQLRKVERVEITEGGCSATLPALPLAVWRGVLPEGPDDDDGRYFASVLIGRPGYYD